MESSFSMSLNILENHGKPWTINDETLLLKKLSNGETISDISIYFKRSEGGIRSRQRELAYRFIEDGKTIKQASEYTKLTIEDIEKSLTLRNISKKSNEIKKEKEETLLSVAIEIRELLKQLLEK